METKSASQMATIYGLKSPQAFNKLLTKCCVLKATDKGYVLSEELRGKGYTAVVEASYFLPNGFKGTSKRMVWTELGQNYVKKTLAHHGVIPVSEQKDLFNA